MTFEEVIKTFGYPGLFVGTFLEGETILILAGFMAHQTYLTIETVIAVAFAGTVAGDQVAFYFGRWRGEKFLAKRPRWRWRARRVRAIVDRYDMWVVLGFRFVYGIRNITPIALGSMGYSPRKYLIFNVIGAAIWAVAFGFIGYYFGEAAKALLGEVRKYEIWLLAGLAAVGFAFWARHLLRRRQEWRKANAHPQHEPSTETQAAAKSGKAA